MNFQEYRKNSSKEVNAYLHHLLSERKEHIGKTSAQLIPLYDLFIKTMSGGKGIRGTLVELGYELTGSLPHKEITKIAAAFEIVHTALLTHDDIIDKSMLRRGKPTLFSALGGDHYGISQAICLGDLGFFLGMKLIAESDFKMELKNHALSVFSEVITDTILGEMLDIAFAHKDQRREEKDVLTIHRLKTAQYTIVGPLVIGAILGGATETLRKNIKLFGESLGIAFQIQDDILGVFGDVKLLGKPVTSDIEEGKNTLLITYALKRSTPSQKKTLRQYYGKGPLTKKQYALVKDIFQDTGALTYSKKAIKQYLLDGKKVIPHLTKSERIKKMLYELSDFLVERQN